MPRTFTIEKTAYKFAELSEMAKQKALESLYDLNVDYDWWDYIYDDAKNVTYWNQNPGGTYLARSLVLRCRWFFS